jgi:hypothetical protein
MDAALQNHLAVGLAALAAAYLLWTWLRPARKKTGCGGACGAVSSGVKKLQQLRRDR